MPSLQQQTEVEPTNNEIQPVSVHSSEWTHSHSLFSKLPVFFPNSSNIKIMFTGSRKYHNLLIRYGPEKLWTPQMCGVFLLVQLQFTSILDFNLVALNCNVIYSHFHKWQLNLKIKISFDALSLMWFLLDLCFALSASLSQLYIKTFFWRILDEKTNLIWSLVYNQMTAMVQRMTEQLEIWHEYVYKWSRTTKANVIQWPQVIWSYSN